MGEVEFELSPVFEHSGSLTICHKGRSNRDGGAGIGELYEQRNGLLYHRQPESVDAIASERVEGVLQVLRETAWPTWAYLLEEHPNDGGARLTSRDPGRCKYLYSGGAFRLLERHA